MDARVLVPHADGLHTVDARRSVRTPGFELTGVRRAVTRTTADRVGAAIAKSGFGFPDGVHVTVEPALDRASGAELAVALAVLLAEPAHAHLRRPGYLALGGLAVDGRVCEHPAPAFAGLPPGGWLARIWLPTDHVPDAGERAILSIVDAPHLAEAWAMLVDLVEYEPASARPVPPVAQPNTVPRGPSSAQP